MTGAAQISTTSSILSRPLRVRRADRLAASPGEGSECTVKPRGCSASAMARGAPKLGTSDKLEPDIKTRQQGAEPEPLEYVAVVLLDAGVRRGPFAQQPRTIVAGLLYRLLPQRQTGFPRKGTKVEILPDRPEVLARELIK